MTEKPPSRITLRFCPECGRTDRFRTDRFMPLSLTRKHYGVKRLCPGRVIEVEYMPVKEVE